MADLNQLTQKYQPVLTAIENVGGRLDGIDLQGEQLHLKAAVPSEASKNRIWDAIKAVDATFADLKHEISDRLRVRSGCSAGPPHALRGVRKRLLRRRQQVHDDRESQRTRRSRQDQGRPGTQDSSGVELEAQLVFLRC